MSFEEKVSLEGFVTPAEAAKFLGVSRSHFYTMMDSQQIPYSKFGRSRRVPKVALVKFAASVMQGGAEMKVNDAKEETR